VTGISRYKVGRVAIRLLRHLTRRKLDFGFVVDSRVSIRIVFRPGTWMGATALAKVLADLRRVQTNTIGQPLDYGVTAETPRYLDRAVISILYDRERHQPIGCNCFLMLDVDLRGRSEEVLHLGLVMLDPAFQAKGYLWVLSGLPCMMMFIRNHGRPLWISSVSQIPLVIGAVSATFADVYPRPPEEVQKGYRHTLIAREIMHRHRAAFGVGEAAGFDEGSFIITNAYTGGSDPLWKPFAMAPKHHARALNKWCRDHLDYARGDDLLQIGRINYNAIVGYLLREVPKQSLPYLLRRIAFLVLGGIFNPLLRWLSARTDFGDLRARN